MIDQPIETPTHPLPLQRKWGANLTRDLPIPSLYTICGKNAGYDMVILVVGLTDLSVGKTINCSGYSWKFHFISPLSFQKAINWIVSSKGKRDLHYQIFPCIIVQDVKKIYLKCLYPCKSIVIWPESWLFNQYLIYPGYDSVSVANINSTQKNIEKKLLSKKWKKCLLPLVAERTEVVTPWYMNAVNTGAVRAVVSISARRICTQIFILGLIIG